ncbi:MULTISPECIES: acyltransferase family protein [unclassified Pseudomonas]|uniref:acyltransferase family protein n=1 Tax=unclassified Pseudomonas TaxID=196821 RepID=UPI0008385A83|nr:MULTISPECIES: acyltransferase family protein [unclassified Pseudomonas]QIH09510.1 acyltransferase [Pseudomonas sp. BIOMIG1BAC]
MTKFEKPDLHFRKDINGLRAWAVVSVILYHFSIYGFSGGFVGVDIFFVISGFLMTAIIVNALEKDGKFSVLNFYLARAKRILPALLVLCITVTIAGWFYLTETEYETLAHHIISAITFLSNIQFWNESGYFDAVSYDKWLLHTWSLSVEWQFYLILPLILVAIWKLKPGRVAAFVTISLAFVASFTTSVILSEQHPSAAFYLLPSRAWEMLAGGLAFFIFSVYSLPNKIKAAIEIIGLALILYSIMTIIPNTTWPGWHAMLPVLGTVLVLGASRQNSYFTGTLLAQWVGNWSYSLYLWHWPIAAALVYLELKTSVPAITAGLITTFVLGYLSYILIEKTSRKTLGSISSPRAFAALMIVALMTLAPSFLIENYNGVPNRSFSEKAELIIAEGSKKNPRADQCFAGELTPVPECKYGGETLGAIVLGDSHAAAIVRSVERALPNKDLYVLDWSLMSCATISGIKIRNNSNYRCSEFLDYAINKQKSLPANVPIIIINRTSAYVIGANEPDRARELVVPDIYITKLYSERTPEFFDEMKNGIIDTACELAKTRPVYMLRPIPELKINVPKTMIRRMAIPGDYGRVSISLNEYMSRHEFVLNAQNSAAEKCGVHILDPIPYLCRDGQCFGDKNGIPLYYDDDHLNEHGDDELVPMFSKIFEKEQKSQAVKVRE